MSKEKLIQFPITATFLVVKDKNKRKLKLLREQDQKGTIRTGVQICGKDKTTFSEISVELFDGESSNNVTVQIFEMEKSSFVLIDTWFIVELGGHHNGEHVICCNNLLPDNSYGGLLLARWFTVGQVIVVSGYSERLTKDILFDKIFARK